MTGKLKKIDINRIINYYENPRHETAQDEKDTLKKLFESVGSQYMLNLADDIKKNGLLSNQYIVVVYDNKIKKYIVYEGNRRIAAIKLLMNPIFFDFLDNQTLNKAKKISNQLQSPINQVNCYVTNEEEAFFIMERVHSGEDKGRGIKSWNSKEKDVFKVRRNNKKTLAYLIDFYVKKYFNNLDITSIISFTTIQRIFGNKKVRSKIGLNILDEKTFTKNRMQLILKISEKIADEAKEKGVSLTRLYNLASEIEKNILPLIESYELEIKNDPNYKEINNIKEEKEIKDIVKEKIGNSKKRDIGSNTSLNDKSNDSLKKNKALETGRRSYGSKNNLPYFFQGIDYSHLDPNDSNSHGISEICQELKFFSDNKLVDKLPIAAAFLVRSAIEQSIKYYSKKTYIQGQDKLIWEDIKEIQNLNSIIKKYKKNLSNYITDKKMKQYFNNLFDDYEKNIDPLNWVVHRPFEFQFDTNTLIEIPRKGLLSLINFFISK